MNIEYSSKITDRFCASFQVLTLRTSGIRFFQLLYVSVTRNFWHTHLIVYQMCRHLNRMESYVDAQLWRSFDSEVKSRMEQSMTYNNQIMNLLIFFMTKTLCLIKRTFSSRTRVSVYETGKYWCDHMRWKKWFGKFAEREAVSSPLAC